MRSLFELWVIMQKRISILGHLDIRPNNKRERMSGRIWGPMFSGRVIVRGRVCVLALCISHEMREYGCASMSELTTSTIRFTGLDLRFEEPTGLIRHAAWVVGVLGEAEIVYVY